MPHPKIIIVGAGSAIFGPNTIATILRSKLLRGCTLGLVDLDAFALESAYRVAERMNEEWDAGTQISASADRKDLLSEADFVIVSIEVPPREELWRLDWEIPTRHGLRQPYGENGGPGGMMHTFRQVPPLMGIVSDMERLCPDAWLINFSNPLPRLTRTVTKYSKIRAVGKCHQIQVGYGIAAVLLANAYGLPLPSGVTLHSGPQNVPRIREMAQIGREHFTITAAGLNHFTWIVDIRDRLTGEDIYPLLRQAAEVPPEGFEPLSMTLFRTFGYCPVPGDAHLAEYLPWTHDPVARPWERYDIQLYDWNANVRFRDDSRRRMAKMADGTLPLEDIRNVRSEGAAELIEAVTHNLVRYDEAVNISNHGAIPNLNESTIVEVPAMLTGHGVRALQLDPLPDAIAELCRREAALVELVVDAAMTGSRDLALQALLLDPMINDIDRATGILSDYLDTFAEHLPQFS